MNNEKLSTVKNVLLDVARMFLVTTASLTASRLLIKAYDKYVSKSEK